MWIFFTVSGLNQLRIYTLLDWPKGADLAEQSDAGTRDSKPPATGGRVPSYWLQHNRSDRQQLQLLGTMVMTEHFSYTVHYTTLQQSVGQTENKTYIKLLLGQKVSQKNLLNMKQPLCKAEMEKNLRFLDHLKPCFVSLGNTNKIIFSSNWNSFQNTSCHQIFYRYNS